MATNEKISKMLRLYDGFREVWNTYLKITVIKFVKGKA